MSKTVSTPICPKCGKTATFYESNSDKEEYYCPACNQFVRLERTASFYNVNSKK